MDSAVSLCGTTQSIIRIVVCKSLLIEGKGCAGLNESISNFVQTWRPSPEILS